MDPFSYLSVLISIILALGMTRVLASIGEMLEARLHRRLYLGAHHLDTRRFYLSGHRLVDFLPLARPAAVDVFPLRFRPDLAHHFISCLASAFSAGRRSRRISRLQSALLCEPSGVFHHPRVVCSR